MKHGKGRYDQYLSQRQLALFAFGIARNVIVAGGNVRRPEPVEMPVNLGIASSSPSFASFPFS